MSWRSARHFELLKTLIDSEPEVVTYGALRERVWHGKEIEPQTIIQTVKDLRGRLGTYADCIRNQPGKGYYFDRPPSGVFQDGNLPLEVLTLLRVAADEWDRRTGESLLRALTLYRRVVETDPACVEGLLGMAVCVTMGCHVGFAVVPRADLHIARKAADRALALAKNNRERAAALCQIAQIRMMYDWDLKEAERLFTEARVLDDSHAPTHHFLSHVYLITDRWDSVMDTIKAARRIAPSSPMIHSTGGLLLHFMRRYKEAIAEGEAAVALHPEFARGYAMLGLAYEADGQFDRAIAAFEMALEMEEHAFALAALGHAHAIAGNRGKARTYFARLRKFAKTQVVSPYFDALIHAGLGAGEEAISCLEQAYDERCDWLLHAGVEPRWDNLRGYERFRQLIKKLGLPEGRA